MKPNEFLKVNPALKGIPWWGLTALCVVLLFAPLSFADDFTAHHLGDYGNVTVMEVNGNYNAKLPDGTLNAVPRQAIAKEFFRTHKDEYDFVTIFTNFDFTMPEDNKAQGFYEGVKNDVKGIGKEIYDNTALYGSIGRLQGTIDMGNLSGKVINPLDPGFDETIMILSHEMQHQWGAYVHFKDATGNVSSALLGRDGSHWSYLLDTKASVMYGNQWQDNGNGTFTSVAAEKYYSPLDLYLMGMIDKSKVPAMLLIENPSIDPARLPEAGATISGTARYVTIDDIIAMEGERIPSAKDSQKQFKMAFIYAVTPNSFKSDDLYGIENIRNAFLTRYSILTDGKALVQVTSTPIDNLPVNPGVTLPTTVPRTLPSDINNGVTWLVGRQQADGSWTDYSLTTERDTAETVTALQHFPIAVQSFQSGFSWLENNAFSNTDFLARHIETSVQAGKDSSVLVRDLVSRRNRDGGWGSGRGFISTPTDTALVLKALALAGFSDSTITGPAIAYLQGNQNPDGGWSGDDAFSTIQPTATVLTAFNSFRSTGALDKNITKAVAFLASKQNSDGGFGNSPSTIYDSALAVIALQTVGADKAMAGRGLGYLQLQQSDDGSWFDSPYQTALAIRAIWGATVTPDLSIKLEDLMTIPAKVTSLPTNVVLSAKVSNLGRTDVLQAKVAVYEGGVTLDKKISETSIAFPGLSQVNVTFSIPVTDNRKHLYYVVIDPDNLITESSKDNNTAAISLTPDITYDFKVASSDITATPNPVDVGKDLKISFKITSASSTDAFNVPIRIYINQPGAPLEIAALTADIPAGGSVVKEVVWKAVHTGVDMPLTVQIDPNNTFTEISKDNNNASIPVTVSYPTYDFKVAPSDITATPNPVDVGKDLKISVKVTNASSTDAFNVPIRIYINQPSAPLEIAALTADIPAGGSVVKEVVWKAVHTGVDMPLTVQIDPNNTFIEISKANNSASIPVTVSYPAFTYDFSVTASDIAVTPNQVDMGKDVKISLKISNSGTSDAYNIPIRLFIDQAGSQLEIAILTVDIPAGGSVVKETVWKASRAGTNMPLTVQIDPNNTFIEINKVNNSASAPLTVIASTLPNLSISYKDMVITPTPAREGGSASISVLVKNDGFSNAENLKVNVYLGIASNGGVLLGSQVIPAIPAGQSARTSIDWNGIAVNGGQLISVQVDPDSAVQELSKDDNFTFLNLDVLSLPDLAITTNSVVINPAMPKSGDQVSISVTVQNGGEQDVSNCAVQVKENGSVIGSIVIPLVKGSSQATGTLAYPNSGRTGNHQITVIVDPDNLVTERSKDNNSIVKTFSIQDANLWLTEAYISPDGDGVKDTTDFSFRLVAPTQVKVQVLNKKWVAVRTFSGGDLDNTTGSTVAWDGKNDAGSVVSDGVYNIQVVATNGSILASLPVEVDTNRSSLADALGTKYLLQSNQTCMLPQYNRMTWMPNESGLAFQLYPTKDSPYLEGLYAMSPDGEDILRLIPGLWNSTTDPNTQYTVPNWVMTQDGQKIALVLSKWDRTVHSSSLSLWVVDTDGNNLAKAYDFGNTSGLEIENVAWSPNGSRLAVAYNQGLYVLRPDTGEMKYVAQYGSSFGGQMEWSQDGSLVYAPSFNDMPAFTLSDPNGVGQYYESGPMQLQGGNIEGWLWDKKILFYSYDTANQLQPMLFDAKDGSFSPLTGVGANLLTISPNKRFIAWADIEGCVDCTISIKQISVMDSARNVTVIAQTEKNPDTPNGVKTGIGNEYVWSKDGSAIAYINTRYNSLDSTFSDELVIHDVEKGTDQRVEVRNYVCENASQLAMAKGAVYTNVSSVTCSSPKKITRFVAWMRDKTNFLLETAEGIFSFNSDDQTSSDFLPLDGSNFLNFSPNERYLTYEKYNDSNSGCFPKWQNQWAMSSLLNLTADLRISKAKTYVTLRGIASDKNLEGYRLEYADIKSPGTWNLIAPPSEAPVLNSIFTTWVPPYEGSFLVRLTAWDKAGNQAVDRKRLNWGMSSMITNLYKSEEYISPNGDGNKDIVELHYQVLEPVHLEVNVYDGNNTLVRSYSRDYADPASDFITWDGKDTTGKVVPDGQYRISVFDYDFFVAVDATLPNVAIELGKFAWKTNNFGYPFANVAVLGQVFDANIKKWEIEYGIGDNPQTWVEQYNGREPMIRLDSHGNPQNVLLRNYINEEIGTLKGMRFRIKAEDYAGNQSSMLSDFVEEKLEVLDWDSNAIVKILTQKDLLPPLYISRGKHTVNGIETYRFRTVRRVLQYQSGGQWMDGVVHDVSDMKGYFSFEWDTSSLNTDLITAVRIKVVDEFGGVNYKVIGIDRKFTIYQPCDTNSIYADYDLADELETLLLQFSYDKGKTWKDIKSTTKRSDNIDCLHEVPLFDRSQIENYYARAIATTKDGIVRIEKVEMSSKKCVAARIEIEVAYDEATVCNTLAPGKATVAVTASFSGEAKVESFKLNMKAPEGDRLLKDFVASADGPVVVDTSNFPEGTYPITATLAYTFISSGTVQHGALTQNASILVSRTLPHVKLTNPSEDTGQTICPLRIKVGDNYKYGLNVAGVSTSIAGIGHYELEWGNGASPGSWGHAQRVFPRNLDYQIHGTGGVNGNIDTWDVSGFKGDTYTLQLRATDAVGNKGCTASSFYLNEPITVASITPSRLLISSVNGYSVDAGYQLTGPATIGIKVFPVIGASPETLGETALRSITSDVRYLSGIEYTSWDGTRDGGAILPDGKYGLTVTSLDSCQLTDVKWADIEIDNTPPVATIDYPRSKDPLPIGNIIEVRVTATDQHFMSYLLEAGEGDSPSNWLAIGSGVRSVSNWKVAAWNTFGLKDIWTLRLTAVDAAGNTSVATSTINLGARKDLIKTFTVVPDLFSPNNDQKRDSAHVSYEVTDACQIKFDMLNAGGSTVKTTIVTTSAAGKGSFDWDGTSATKDVVADGVYTVRMYASLTGKPEVNQTETLTLTVDKTAPQIIIPIPIDKAYYNKTDMPIIGSITDQNLDSYTVSVTGPDGTSVLDSGNQIRTGYTFGTISNLAEDTYTLTAIANDLGENQTKLVRSFTIDRTPPKVVLDTPKTGEYYGTAKNVIDISGSIVEKNLERFSLRYGVGEMPTDWKEVVGGDTVPVASKLSSLKVGKSDGIADGLYTFSLYAKDKAGLEGEARAKVVIDNTPPQVAITLPKDGSYATKPFDIKGTAADTYFDTATLELAEGSCATAVKWVVSKTLSAQVQDSILDSWKMLPADGEYCLKLSATDKSGNKSEAKTGIKIDTHPPAAPQLTGKVDNKSDAVLSWTKNTEPDLAGYNLYRNSQKINASLVVDTTYRDPSLKEDSYVYSIKAVDFAGNESDSSNTVSLKIDLSGPSVKISSPGNATTVSNLVDIKGTAYSQDDFKEYRLYIGQGSSPSSWILIRRSPLAISYGLLAQWDTITSQDGSQFSIKLEGEDLSGNISTTQAIVTIDNTPPRAPVLLTVAGNNANATLTWKANTEADLAGYLLYRNDQLANVTGIVAGNLKPYIVTGTSYTDKSLPDGTYRYYLMAMDQAGNISDQSNTLEVDIDTHPPHMTITAPVNGQKFNGKLTINAETTDNDIASVQFQYKQKQDAAWINLGTPFTKSPFVTYLDPKALNFSYGDYQIQALATDRHNKIDPSPAVVTVTYADLTPPDVPSGLATKVNGDKVNLTWNAVSESGAGYNVYRWNAGVKTLITSTPVKNTSHLDSGVADGAYQYEITAIDAAGNESKVSEQAAAKIYAPVIIQPFTPLKTPALILQGNGVDPGAQVQLTTVRPSGDSSTTTLTADTSGLYWLEGITLALGVSRFTAVATDSAGNISRNSDTSVVAYGLPPVVPTGLAASVSGYDVNLTWNANSEQNVIGYNLFRDGEKVNAAVALTGGQALASSQASSAAPQNAIDGNNSTYWGTPYGNGIFTPAWWQMSLPAPELISRLDITWQLGDWDYANDKYIILAGKDFEVQGWSGYNWVTLKKVVNNDQQNNTIDISPSYRTDRIRIAIASTTDPNYSKYVRINEIKFTKENLIPLPRFTDAGLIDHRYAYTVTAVNQYGFESDPSSPAIAAVGDLEPPGPPRDLSAMPQGSSVALSWNPPAPLAGDIANYYVYLQTSSGWSQLRTLGASETACTLPGFSNGTYRFRVTAIDAAGNESSPSNEAEAVVSIEMPKPPALAVSSPSTGNALDLVWQGPSGTGPFFYKLYRSLNETDSFSQVNSAVITGTKFRDFGLTNGTAYYYRVSAVDMVGNEGKPSNTASGIPRDVLSLQPSILMPTMLGTPLVIKQNGITVGGFAEPGSKVAVLRDGAMVGSTDASAKDIQTDTALDLDFDNSALSPDRQTLAAVDHFGQLLLINMKSDETFVVPADGFNDFSSNTLQWSPDGRYLLASVNDYSSKRRIVLYDRDLSETRLLTTNETQAEWDASWSSAGGTIIFAGTDGNGRNGIWKAQTGNSGATLLSNNTNNPIYPRLSADGNHVAFFNTDGLSLLSLSDSSISLLDANTDGRTFSWAPDGSKLLYVSNRDGGNGEFYQVNLADRAVSRLTYGNLGGYNAVWSPDGKQLAYVARGVLGEVVHIAPLDSEERELPASQDRIFSIEWRQNGELLYLNQSGSHVISPAGTFSLPNASLTPGENRIVAVATDSSGNISDPSEAISVTLDTGEWPDLAISDSDITFFPPYPKPGEDVLVTARVHNPTGNAVDNVAAELYLWDGSNDVTLLKADVIQHLAANGEENVSFRFNAGSVSGTRTVIAVVDPSNLIQEVLETNNYASKDLVVTGKEQVSISTTLGSLQYGINQNISVGVNLMNGGTSTTGILKVMIEDSDGNPVKQLISQPQDLAYGMNLKQTFAWNTGTTYAGAYRAHASVTDSTGTAVLAEHVTVFSILPDLQTSGTVTTDKQSYGSIEPVTLGVTFKNSSVNYVIPQLKARVRITDASNGQLFSEEKTFTNLLPATGGNFTSVWNTGMSPAGVYSVSVDISVGDSVLTTKTATFTIVARPLLKGALSVDTAAVLSGHGFTSTYTVSNQGNSATAGTVRVALQDPDTQVTVASFDQSATLAANGSIPGNAIFDTTGLALKTYQVVLWFKAGTAWQSIAMTTIGVRDGIAPVITAISPQEGARYTTEVPLSVFASDDVSGVDKVEYSLDGHIWKTLPVADPAKGMYSASWALAHTDNGSRTILLRGTDRAGNTSQPVSVNFIVQGDTTPPILSVSTLSNGSFTNNQVLNITGTATDDTGIKDLQINSVSIPVNSDGSFSYALTLQSGANQVTVNAIDLAGNQSSDNRIINLDQTAPRLTITAPADNSKVGSALVAVTGTVDETSTVTVKLGGSIQTAAMNGSNFTATVNLVSGTNTIEVTATDLVGNSSTQKRTITYDDQNPSLAIIFPTQDIRTNQSYLTIQGTTSDPYSAVTVNVAMDGQTYSPTVENGQFSQALGFTAEKTYSIVITAINEVGKATTAQRNIIYDITSPALAINPVTTPTTQTGQTVTGTRESGLIVTVNCATATVGAITYPTDTTWSVDLSGMQVGDNLVSVSSTDAAGNTNKVFATISVTTGGATTFSFAVFGNNSVIMTGGAYVDSYVGNPASHSTGQHRYGNVGTNSLQVCGIRMTGGTQIYGDASVGVGGSPGTSVCLTPGTAVSGTKGALTTAQNMTPVTDPGGVTSSGTLNLFGSSTQTLTSGNYRYSSISLSGAAKLILNGKITLHVDGNVSLSGGSSLVIASGSVVIYVNGSRIDINGGSVVNSTLDPANFVIYGSSGVNTVNLSGGTNLHGLIFAPVADIKVSGGHQTYGSIMGKTVNLSGGVSVHYPEGLTK